MKGSYFNFLNHPGFSVRLEKKTVLFCPQIHPLILPPTDPHRAMESSHIWRSMDSRLGTWCAPTGPLRMCPFSLRGVPAYISPQEKTDSRTSSCPTLVFVKTLAYREGKEDAKWVSNLPHSEGGAFNLGPSSRSTAQINTTQNNIEKEKKKIYHWEPNIWDLETFYIAVYTDLTIQIRIWFLILSCVALFSTKSSVQSNHYLLKAYSVISTMLWGGYRRTTRYGLMLLYC